MLALTQDEDSSECATDLSGKWSARDADGKTYIVSVVQARPGTTTILGYFSSLPPGLE